MKQVVYVIILVFVYLIYDNLAYGRYEERSGLNFGTSLKILSNLDHNKASDQTTTNSKVIEKTNAVHPYVGYAFSEFFNVGITLGYENISSIKSYINQSDSKKINLTTQTITRSASLYSRFMFADYFYFESGLGIYQQKLYVLNEYTSENGNGIFSGEKEEYTTTGIGLGWHFGGGIEIPITNGFYVNTNYITRAVEIHDFKNNDQIGPKKGTLQKQELNFGIAYYLGM